MGSNRNIRREHKVADLVLPTLGTRQRSRIASGDGFKILCVEEDGRVLVTYNNQSIARRAGHQSEAASLSTGRTVRSQRPCRSANFHDRRPAVQRYWRSAAKARGSAATDSFGSCNAGLGSISA
jgi:hypothetical protein